MIELDKADAALRTALVAGPVDDARGELRKHRPSGENGYTDILWQMHNATTDIRQRDALREAISVICREPDLLAERELMIVSHNNLVAELETSQGPPMTARRGVPQCEAKPVAWRWRAPSWKAGEWLYTTLMSSDPDPALIVDPLYATTPPSRSDAESVEPDDHFLFTYKNHRGETSTRIVTPTSVRWGSTEWHKQPQWLLRAFDQEKQAEREFAMDDMFAVPPPSEAAIAELLHTHLALKTNDVNPDEWCCRITGIGDAARAIAALVHLPPSEGRVLPKELHWLGDRESADATHHALDMTGCVAYFEQQSDCLQFMRWLTALPAPPSGREAREKQITRLATIEECAQLCDRLKAYDPRSEKDYGKAIRALSPDPGTVAELRKLQDIIDNQADRILDLEARLASRVRDSG